MQPFQSSAALIRHSTWGLLGKRAQPARCIHATGATGKKSEPVKGQSDTNDARKAKNQSLLEELFPEERERAKSAPTPQRPVAREIPRLPLELSKAAAHKMREAEYALEYNQAALNRKGTPSSVLVLRNASKNLVEDDFRRLIPKGKHLEGWNIADADIEKVFPGRDITTLEHLGYYYLLFRNAKSAYTYQGRATRISKLVQSVIPSSLESVIPPAPGINFQGEDVLDLMQMYTLTPSTQNIELRQLAPPLTPMLEMIIKAQGHPEIVNREGNSPAEVLVRLEGPQLNAKTILLAFRKWQRECNVPQAEHGPGSLVVTPYEPQGERHVSPLSRKPQAIAYTASKDAETSATLGEAGLDERAESEPQTEDELRRFQLYDKRHRRTPVVSYILGFTTSAEADAYVRHWHRRVMPLPDGGSSYDDGDSAPIVNAEILW